MDGEIRAKTGGKTLASRTTLNLSNGRTFAVVDVEGKPLTAGLRAPAARSGSRWIEVMQTKGNSETHPTLVAERRIRRLRHNKAGTTAT